MYCFVQDTKDPQLLFVGTEFGLYFTHNGGKNWLKLNGGMPIQCIRDITIQRRDDDLVVATFGRGFYILDDLSPLRAMNSEAKLTQEAVLLPVRKALLYVQASPLGGPGKAEQGERYFMGENPPFGATFTYYLKESFESLRERRRALEKSQVKAGSDTFYPVWDSVRAEEREEAPTVLLTVSDAQGNVVRRLTAPASAGFHRVAWDFRRPDPAPAQLEPRVRSDFDDGSGSPLVAPGTYRVQLAKRVRGVVTNLGEPQGFVCEPLQNTALPAPDRAALAEFQAKVLRLERVLAGTQRVLADAQQTAQLLRKALDEAPSAAAVPLRAEAAQTIDRLRDLSNTLNGDAEIRHHEEPTPPSLADRIDRVAGGSWSSTAKPTATHQRAYDIASSSLTRVIADLRGTLDALRALGDKAEAAGAAWTPGRVPEWKPE